MALQVPDQQIPQIKTLLDLADDDIKKFLKALDEAGPKFNYLELAADVETRTKLGRRFTEEVIGMLASLYLTRERQSIPIEDFVDEQVAPALKKAIAKSPEEDESRWAKFRSFLLTALSFDNSLGTAAKAGYVLTEHERIFDDARIVTDVRSIFHPDVTELPRAALLIHMLRITQRDRFGKRKAHYFALDANDIRVLKGIVDRAIKKEETLKETMKHSPINILDPKPTF